MDAHEAYWAEQNPAVVFIMALQDLNQPWSCEEWGDQGVSGAPVIVENVGGQLFDLFHDSWNAFPTYVLIDHTMTVRAKTWPYDSNGNTNPCDGTNTTMPGFSGGDTDDFLQYLVDECGTLCEGCSGTVDSDGDGIADECDDCFNMSGDPNEDAVIDILDIVSIVNIILNGGINSPNYTQCEIENANLNSDGSINVLDIIQIINIILGENRTYSEMSGHSDLYFIPEGDNLIIKVDSDIDVSGVQLSFYTDHVHSISLNDRSDDVYTASNVNEGIQYFVGFSMENNPFDKDLEIIVSGGFDLSADDMDIILSSTSGQSVDIDWNLPELKSFSIDKMFPNPFNPSTEINYTVKHDGNLNIAVYNLLGQQIAELYNGYQELGPHKVLWNAENVASGVYYVNITHQNGQSESMKAVLLK